VHTAAPGVLSRPIVSGECSDGRASRHGRQKSSARITAIQHRPSLLKPPRGHLILRAR
jgi:hypothetical protein